MRISLMGGSMLHILLFDEHEVSTFGTDKQIKHSERNKRETMMSLFTNLIAPLVTAFVIILVLRLVSNRGKRSRERLPPGDNGWPIVGSTFAFFKPHSPTVIGDFVSHQLSKHGKIFTTRFLGKTTIISTDPDLNRLVLQNQMRLFENDLPPHIQTLLGDYNLAFLEGDRYKHLKSMLLSFINSWEIQTSFLELVQNAVDRVLGSWKEKDIVYVCQETHKFAFNILAEKAVGLKAEDPETEELRKEFITLNEGFHGVPINLPKTNYWRALRARENIVKSIKKRAEKKKAEDRKNIRPSDWLGWLLTNNSDESIDNICSPVIGLILAALFNTSIVISLAIYFMRSYPKVIQHMQDEYLKILREKKDSKAKITWEDYKKMEFCQCVINETLRLGNLFPGLFKMAMQDVEFKGYVFPKGTMVVPYSEAMHLDPNVFERPENFDPWRWQSIKKTNHWMPFGGGQRYCSGSEIARIKIAIFLHRFCLTYDWKPVEPDHPIAPPVVFPKELPIRVYPLNINV
ncbi:hypothetical protein LUZ60_015165 [Juncus effusus]|nr:hypothetical protein LUZ60_015165 [Juncus effusus]